MTQPLLSICIPTYNREYLIGDCLGKICPAAAKYGVEVVVSDNASTDGTEAIIRDYASRYDNLVYVRQSENIGPDANFESVLRAATGNYRWLMGDGSYVTEEEIKRVLSETQKGYYAIVVNDALGKRMPGTEKKIYKDANALLSEVGWHMTSISALIYSDRLIKEANFVRYYNSSFIQTGIIFEFLSDKACNVLVDPQVHVYEIPVEKKNSWQSRAFEVFCKQWYVFVMSLPVCYTVESKRECIKNHSIKSNLFTISGLLYLRSKGYVSLKDYRKFEFYVREVIPLRQWIVRSLLRMPPRLLVPKLRHIIGSGKLFSCIRDKALKI